MRALSSISSDPPLPRIALPPSLARQGAIWLFVCFQLFYVLTASGRLHVVDEYETFYMTESLVERGELTLPPEKSFFGRKDQAGRFHAPYGPLLSVLATPAYVTGRVAGRVLDAGETAREALLWCFTSLVNTTVAAAAVAVLFRLALTLGAAPLAALFAAAAFGLATPHWHYASTFFSEPLSALLLLVSITILVGHPEPRRDGLRLRTLLLAGLPLALMAWNRLTMAIYFPALAVAVFALFGRSIRERVLAAASLCVLPAVAVGLYILWNAIRFGNALELGYPDQIAGEAASFGFHGSFLTGLYGLTFSPGKGLIVFALPALIGLGLGGKFVRRTGALGGWLLLVPCVPLLFYAGYSHWEGGNCWGPRFLMPSLALWILPLAFWTPAGRISRWACGLATGLSAGVQALGVSVSFMECQVNSALFQPDYYSRGYVYNIGHSALSETWTVFSHYAGEALRQGRFLAETEGLGFDRWFFFLAQNGLPAITLTFGVVSLTVLFGLSIVALHGAVLRLHIAHSAPKRGKEIVKGDPVLA